MPSVDDYRDCVRKQVVADHLDVLDELPRTRETVLLRVLGAGKVLKQAMRDLARLPEDAWEREVAMPPLLALRIEIPHDSADADEQEYLMNSMELYEQWGRGLRTARLTSWCYLRPVSSPAPPLARIAV